MSPFTNKELKEHIATRFTVNPETECWEWNRATDRLGYARTNYVDENGKWKVLLNLHRYVFKAYNGRIRKATPVIRHRCNNRCCINPAHLVQGTQYENVRDAILSNTHASLHQNEVRRLTPEERHEVYVALSEGESMYSVAKRFNSSISNIFTYKQRLSNWLIKQEKKKTEMEDATDVTITETLTIKEA